MNETPEPAIESDRPDAVHGLAPGDRVMITDGELNGAYGKVVQAFYGCGKSCRFNCYLVEVELMAKPPGVEPRPVRIRNGDVMTFKASEVSHAD